MNLHRATIAFTIALTLMAACGEDDPVIPPPPTTKHFVKNMPPLKDNSMYEEAADSSNGVGIYIFTGENANGDAPPPDARRALLAFAIAGNLPAGAVIDSVRLQLHMSKTPGLAGTRVTSLHRLEADWGEGASDATGEEGFGGTAGPNDATWVYRFFNTVTWTAPGGDFVPGPSAQLPVASLGFYVWSSTEMAADVQLWLDTPANNFGWIVIGDESTIETAKRFDSRENPTAANRPKLTVYYTVP